MMKKLRAKIKDESGDSHLGLLTFMFKILVIFLLLLQLSIFLIDTSKCYIAIYETMRKAQSEGVVRRDYLNSQLVRFNKQPSQLAATASPDFDTYANKLGDRLILRIQYSFTISFGDYWAIALPITLVVSGTNQGYYGSGYGGSW